MQSAGQAYKESVKNVYRNQWNMLVTVGIINQAAQKAAEIRNEETCSYLSNLRDLFNGYDVEFCYATLEQNLWRADGTMLFPPRDGAATDYIINQGAISADMRGSIRIDFGQSYDIRGLTVDWGYNFPVDFTVSNGSVAKNYAGNTERYWQTEDIFEGTSYLLITPSKMSGGENRLRIQKITMGIGVSFENRKITKSVLTEHGSLIMESLPTTDFSLSTDNHGRLWDVENRRSAINYLEIGQEVTARYGYDMPDGSTFWLDGCKCRLTGWKADDETMTFQAKDQFAALTDIYRKGRYRPEGTTLLDLAKDVLTDAGLEERDYKLDSYLQKVKVVNPLPCVSHAKCLQLIANAGRCRLYQDRTGRISIKAAFATVITPERMTIQSEDGTNWSNLPSVINGAEKILYSAVTKDYLRADGSRYFLPKFQNFMPAGFVSEQVADAAGNFTKNPKVTVKFEAAVTYYSLWLSFASAPPEGVTIHSYKDGVLIESYAHTEPMQGRSCIAHEFPDADTMVLEFTRGKPYSRIYLSEVVFADVTDYVMTYKAMTKSPEGIQQDKVRRVNVVQTVYQAAAEEQNILTENVDLTERATYKAEFSGPMYDVRVSAGGQQLPVLDSSCYFVVADTSGLSGVQSVSVGGKKYETQKKIFSRELNSTGTLEEWSNPLISDEELASLQAEWLGNYYNNNVEYVLSYRGEPRIDAGDILWLENKYLGNTQIQAYEHKLSFNGGLSGSMKARRAMTG